MAEGKRPGHRYDRSIEKLKRRETTAIQVINYNNIRSTYKNVVEQAFRMKRIDAKTRLKLLSSEEVSKESTHLGILYSNRDHWFYNNNVLKNAVLNHDVIEKGLLCYKELQAEFGKETANLIASVTDYRYVDRRGRFLREWIPNRGLRELTWRERKEASLERLKKSDVNVVILKLVDAEYELSEIAANGLDKSIADWESLKWYYGELLKLFRKTSKLRFSLTMRDFTSIYKELFQQNKT